MHEVKLFNYTINPGRNMHSEFQTAKNLFRRCGGSIYNAKRSVGILGGGLFKVDREKPSAIYVPEKLLVDGKRLAIKNEKMVLLDTKALSKTSLSFLSFYIENFINKGKFGITEAKSFALFLNSSKEIWMTLGLNKKQKILESQQGDLLKVLANSRFISYKNRKVLFPMLELINHSAMGKEFRFYSQNAITKQNETGVCIYQRVGQELLANYGKNV